MAQPESEFPTIKDLRDRLSVLVENGLGDLPVQLVVAPDSTMQALARANEQNSPLPALMIEYPREGHVLGVSFISTDRLSGGGGMKSREAH